MCSFPTCENFSWLEGGFDIALITRRETKGFINHALEMYRYSTLTRADVRWPWRRPVTGKLMTVKCLTGKRMNEVSLNL